MTSPWQRWRVKPTKSYVITNPQLKGLPRNVPGDLEPSKRWTGVIRKRENIALTLHDGRHYTGIYASHRDRPYLIRIPKSTSKLLEGTKAISSRNGAAEGAHRLRRKAPVEGTGAKLFAMSRPPIQAKCSAGVNSPPIWGNILVMTTHVSLELGGMGTGEEKAPVGFG
jgi:hypothetical protein